MNSRTKFIATLSLLWLLSTAGVLAQVDSAKGDSGNTTVVVKPSAPDTAMSDSARKAFTENVLRGQALFQGGMALANGGPSCISCHNVKAEGVVPGGLLAKDLTHVFSRLGDAGLPPILSSTPFPAMAAAYRNKPLTPEEVIAITAFLKDVDQKAPIAEPAPDHTLLLAGGSIGLILWFGFIALLWSRRKTESTKKAIYDRQRHDSWF